MVALQAWRYKLRGTIVLISSDSVVALAMLKKLASGSPALNYLGACLAWTLEVGGVFSLVGHHLAGALNTEADWLSRPQKQLDMEAPTTLAGLKVKDISVNLAAWFPFASPAGDAALWGADTNNVRSVFESL